MSVARQHSAFKSICLHLIPGLFILALIFSFSNQFFTSLLGIDNRLGPIVGYLMAILCGLIPIQLGIILIASKVETGTFKLKGTIKNTEISTRKQYLIIIPSLILYSLILFVIVAPVIQPYIIKTFFSWWPEQYNFQLILQDPTSIASFKGVKTLLVFYILLSCVLGPLVEELYFRGYLLPRMEKFSGSWAPFLNTLLFSVYHFFSPWEILIRIVAIYPLVHIVWKKKDIRIGILVHIILNTIGGIIMIVLIS
jgi:uncharacterized protein